jgi:hypothetical protein
VGRIRAPRGGCSLQMALACAVAQNLRPGAGEQLPRRRVRHPPAGSRPLAACTATGACSGGGCQGSSDRVREKSTRALRRAAGGRRGALDGGQSGTPAQVRGDALSRECELLCYLLDWASCFWAIALLSRGLAAGEERRRRLFSPNCRRGAAPLKVSNSLWDSDTRFKRSGKKQK